MTILEDHSLLTHNTFGIDVSAKYFASIDSVNALSDLLSNKLYKQEDKLILGGGSNVLFTKDQDALVLLNQIKGIEVESEDAKSWTVSAGGGENWHDFVLHCIEKNYAGLENMSLIPGSVGASPIQNIGAYGTEVKDVFEWLDAYHIPTGEVHRLSHSDCNFGYRDSIFKNKLKGEYFILKVAYRLAKHPNLNTSYGAINKALENQNISTPTLKNISDAVISIRTSKLPDPKKIGNSGSFFKNPIIDNVTLNSVKENYPELTTYPVSKTHSKVAAGWLIDKAGWKGKTINNYGVHKNQALVLVNYGGATGKEIYDLSSDIIQSIKEKYGIELEREVNVL